MNDNKEYIEELVKLKWMVSEFIDRYRYELDDIDRGKVYELERQIHICTASIPLE